MKATIHLPTVQFGYIEIVADVESENVESLITLHNELVEAYKATQKDDEDWGGM